MPKHEVECPAPPQGPHDVGASCRHGNEQRIVDPHVVATDLNEATASGDRADRSLDVHGMPAGLAGEMHGEQIILERHGADGAVDPIGKPVVGERHVAAAERNIGRHGPAAAHDVRPQVDLARRQELAPVRCDRLRQETLPVAAHKHPVRLDEEVEVGVLAPARELAGAAHKCRAGVGLQPLARQPAAVGSERRRHVADRERQRGMLEAARFEWAGNREGSRVERVKCARRPPFQIESSP